MGQSPDDSAPTDETFLPFQDMGIVAASRIGRSHVQAGSFREDAFVVRAKESVKDPWFAIFVADGLGSCPLSRVGARIATAAAGDVLTRVSSRNLRIAPRTHVSLAAVWGLQSLRNEAELRKVEPREMACTLLGLLCVKDGDAWEVATFQAGDGMIAAAGWDGSLVELGASDSFAYSGETLPLTSKEVERTWEERSRLHRFATLPDTLLVMSDGVSDDLIPVSANGPILMAELAKVTRSRTPGASLLDILGYEKAGSFDDRTLVMATTLSPGQAREDAPLPQDGKQVP